MLHRWKKEFQDKAASVFYDKRDPKQKAQSQGYAPGESPDDLKKIIEASENWINFYNHHRPHEGLGNCSPNQFATDHGLPAAPYLALS